VAGPCHCERSEAISIINRKAIYGKNPKYESQEAKKYKKQNIFIDLAEIKCIFNNESR
jgi:hypothetical protein